jgi:hypothetical protein
MYYMGGKGGFHHKFFQIKIISQYISHLNEHECSIDYIIYVGLKFVSINEKQH